MARVRETETRAAEVADARAGLAHTMHDAVMFVICDFQAQLSSEEEVGACLTSFGQQITINITSIGFRNPHLMVFYGVDQEGREVQLVQHTSQVNLMLVPVPATSQPARRIGFDVETEC